MRWYSSKYCVSGGCLLSEMSAYKIQTSGNYPEESIQHSEHGESLKSRVLHITRNNTTI